MEPDLNINTVETVLDLDDCLITRLKPGDE
jgi:hypothetical protein